MDTCRLDVFYYFIISDSFANQPSGDISWRQIAWFYRFAFSLK